MTVEIRELVIRVVAQFDERPVLEPDAQEAVMRGHDSQADREKIVQEAVRQVLRILKKTGER